MHNIDVVQRIMDYFLMHEQQQQQKQQNIGKTNVSKILDNYLAEVARDPNLSITKFQVLAESLPENARTCHDGLYRAIDTSASASCYSKETPPLPERHQTLPSSYYSSHCYHPSPIVCHQASASFPPRQYSIPSPFSFSPSRPELPLSETAPATAKVGS